LLVSAIFVAGLLPSSRATSRAGQLEADKQFGILERSTNLVLRGFARDGRIRLYFTEQEPCVMLKAEWDMPRMEAVEFSSASAILEADKSPPPMPSPAAGWHEIRVLDRALSERVLRSVVERLVPPQPGQGIFCRHAFGDAVLFRDAKF
jgi:hypothetical protein